MPKIHKPTSNISPKAPKLFRVISYNIAHGRANSFHQAFLSKNKINLNCLEIGNFLITTEADIVLLQEIDFKAIWTNKLNQTSIINHSKEFPYSCEGNHNQPNQLFHFEYGNAILSKHKIISNQHLSFEDKYLGGKGSQKAVIQWNNKNISFFNVHLHPFSNNKRQKQLEKLGDVLSQTPKPYLIGGDFNMQLDNHLLQYFINKFELFSPPQPAPTYQFYNWKKQIDFIFGSNDIDWQNAEVPSVKLSDHFPLVQDFVLKGKH